MIEKVDVRPSVMPYLYVDDDCNPYENDSPISDVKRDYYICFVSSDAT
jgi:hypothetical protein